MTSEWDPTTSNLYQHAKRELDRAGLSDPDADYGGMLADAALELVETFARQGHSGASAMMTISLFSSLANYLPITPLTDDPDEWQEHAEDNWQSKRNPAAFSSDQGKSYYNVNEHLPEGADPTIIQTVPHNDPNQENNG